MIEDIKNYYNTENCVKKYSEDVDDVKLWASEKHIISKYIKTTDKILDVGCGAGRTTINLYKEGYTNIVGLDLATNLLAFAKEYCKKSNLYIEFVNQSATDIKFENEKFDAVIFSYNGFMCIPGKANRRKALQEIYRVLKADGFFIFTAHDRDNPKFLKFWQEEKSRWENGTQDKNLESFGDRFMPDEFGQESYIHIPSKLEAQTLCQEVGFKVLECVNNLEIGTPDEASRETNFWVVQKIFKTNKK